MRGRAVLNEDVSGRGGAPARGASSKTRFAWTNATWPLCWDLPIALWEVNMYLSDIAPGRRVSPRRRLEGASLAPTAPMCVAATAPCLGDGLPDRALREFELAITIDRNLAVAHGYSGLMKFFLGRFGETEGHVAEALRLSPRDPLLFLWRYFIGSADLCLGRTVRA